MESVIKKLGKVSITVEKDYHSSIKEYNKLTIIEEEGTFKTYISRKPVPVGIALTNREYWIPFSGVLESITFDYLKFKKDYASGKAIEDNAIITRHILNRNIERIKIALKAISEEELDDNAVIERTIKDRNITSNKIAQENIITEHFAKKSVITSILADYAITAIKLADNSITTRTIVNESVTQEKLANNSVNESKIVDKSITNSKIADDTIEIEKLSSTLKETIKNPSSYTKVSGVLNIKDANAITEAQNALKEAGQYSTYIITDSNGNYPSITEKFVYLDDMEQLRDLLYKGNDKALSTLLDNKEAYYNINGNWFSKNITDYITVPSFNLQSVKVGDLVTIIRQEFTSDEFYSKYINFDNITIDDTAFQLYKVSRGYGSNTDGEFIKFLIRNGEIYSSPSNPQTTESETYPLAIDEKVVFYTAQITPNTATVYCGEFWTGNIEAPGIYCYITLGRPEGITDNFIGFVSPDGTKMLLSMKNPYNSYVLENGKWKKIEVSGGVGKNTGGTGEIFNDYSGNIAHSDHAHAEGQGCKAKSYNAHAEGFQTTAGHNAHSENYMTTASGQNSHAEGDRTVASGLASHAEGSSYSDDEGTITLIASGDYSHAEGLGNTASGIGSHAEGLTNTVSGNCSHVEGASNEAKGVCSHAEGDSNVASGDSSHAEGSGTIASGNSSHAEGYQTVSSNKYSHTEGYYTKASGENSHAEGHNTEAGGNNSHAEGDATKAIGHFSHAEGTMTIANDYSSHAEGNQTKASGKDSHAEGLSTIASGNGSHAEGNNTKATKNYSHTEGAYTEAVDDACHSEGMYTCTQSIYPAIHIVGIGTSDTDRKNAHVILKSGAHYIYGIGGYIGNNIGSSHSLQEVIPHIINFDISAASIDFNSKNDDGSVTVTPEQITAIFGMPFENIISNILNGFVTGFRKGIMFFYIVYCCEQEGFRIKYEDKVGDTVTDISLLKKETEFRLYYEEY